MSNTETLYPNCDKLAALTNEHEAIVDFAEWLNDTKRIQLGRHEQFEGYRDPQFAPIATPVDKLVLEFLGIDPVALEQERRALLAAARQDAASR